MIWPKLFEKERRLILTSRLMGVEGRLQREGEVAHLVVYRVRDFTPDLDALGTSSRPKPRDLFEPDRWVTGLNQKSRDFR